MFRQRIHMKNQASVSSKDKCKKKIKMSSAAIFARRFKSENDNAGF